MLFLTTYLPKKFKADECNIMQEGSEYLEVTHSHSNFTLGNQFKGIMKKKADAGNIDSRRNLHRKRSPSKNAEIENYLSTHYEFRYNTVLGRTEYCSKGNNRFVKIGRYEINTFRRELDCDESIATSAENLYSIIESSFSPRINPVQEYFKELPLIDIGDGSSNGSSYSGSSVPISFSPKAIPNLASCVVVRNSNKWLPYLTKWLVAVVANAIDDRECRNHTCLVLTGEQGKFKTTFLDLLCPPKLHGYSYTGKIYPQEKDILTYIGQNLIVNIDDQLKALNKRNENELKNLITCPMVKYRMPYDKYVEEYPHLASFVASVNGNDFLTDPTGSRRFLPFEVLSIDVEKAKRMGEALKKAGYIKVSKRRNGGSPIYVYKIRKILPCPLLQTCSNQM
ncbi:VapE domain-containing protein [Segatella oris]|uniref:Predicted P-loop ATPase and inactivated derivatives n=1 Tax=Segatella oris TaxID=28135 RepID=A0A3S4TG70_9BACT|nr:VapE domain-containing protein [Segatella oris]VEH16284.1 Predicted P-loop ATPase and inactivated derivatives [Segatella oris]